MKGKQVQIYGLTFQVQMDGISCEVKNMEEKLSDMPEWGVEKRTGEQRKPHVGGQKIYR